MALLPTSAMDESATRVMQMLSSAHAELPNDIVKADVRAMLQIIDSHLSQAESASVVAVPAGSKKTWVEANMAYWRQGLEVIAQKRREVL